MGESLSHLRHQSPISVAIFPHPGAGASGPWRASSGLRCQNHECLTIADSMDSKLTTVRPSTHCLLPFSADCIMEFICSFNICPSVPDEGYGVSQIVSRLGLIPTTLLESLRKLKPRKLSTICNIYSLIGEEQKRCNKAGFNRETSDVL